MSPDVVPPAGIVEGDPGPPLASEAGLEDARPAEEPPPLPPPMLGPQFGNAPADALPQSLVPPDLPAAPRCANRGGAALRPLLPYAMTFPGLQHLMSNLCADVHVSLSYWDTFWKQLKNVEPLLTVEERRMRFVATCMRGTSLEFRERMFRTWAHDLYEARWGAVLDFLKHVEPLVPILAAAWHTEKYIRNVEVGSTGASARPAQAQAQQRHEQRQGLNTFDPQALGATLRNGLFSRI